MDTHATIILPKMITWARERSGGTLDDFASRMGVSADCVRQWEVGEKRITMKQAERLCELALVPLGCLFLDKVPGRRVFLPDFRSVNSRPVLNPTPELEATILDMQEKQCWLREYLIENGYDELGFVGSVTLSTPVKDAASRINEVLGLAQEQRDSCRNWDDYFKMMCELTEDAGITLIRNGIYRNDTHRPLDVEEFRGFVLVDPYAPLVFINGRDSRNAQMFTLVHELAHILLGKGGVVDVSLEHGSMNRTERYCNSVAAEFLVPRESILEEAGSLPMDREHIGGSIGALSRRYMVSKLVVISRCRELGIIDGELAGRLWALETAAIRSRKKGGGGDFYAALRQRVGLTFARMVISETAAGNITYRDAFRLLNVKNSAALVRLSQAVGLPIL